MTKTEPKKRFPKDYKIDPSTLAAGRYGTLEMVEIWGAEKTFEYQLRSQGIAALVLSEMHPEIIPKNLAEEIDRAATTKVIDPNRIREIEDGIGHDIIAINKALEEKVSKEAGAHIHKAKTSADVTQPARALQLKESLEIIASSIDNLRDIVLEKSMSWIDIPHMDTSHLYDALPTVAGRPFSHYAEMISKGLDFLTFVYENAIIGKWADATGNHHSASSLGIKGNELQKTYCNKLGISFTDAPAQVPGLEFEAMIGFSMEILSETMNNLAQYIAWGRSDDVNVFVNANPKKKKGSSAMPHKDSKNGNPVIEEQTMSLRNYWLGNAVTFAANSQMQYARNLAASSNSRINWEDGFKYMDHTIRRLADTVFWLGVNEDRSKERVLRSYGVVTSQQVMTYLTDPRKTNKPMTRSEAHNLTAELAKVAWDNKKQFVDIVLENEEVTSRLGESTLISITNPLGYIGESKEIVRMVFDKYHKLKTLKLNDK